MKKILSVIVILTQMLTASFAVADDQPTASTLTLTKINTEREELEAIKSSVLAIQHQVQEHQASAGLSTPPFFCQRFVGNPKVANLDLIQIKRMQIENVQREYNECSDSAKKEKLAEEIDFLTAKFNEEMMKKNQYEAAVTTLLGLKVELDACMLKMQAIAQQVSKPDPASVAMREKQVETLEPSVISVKMAEAFYNEVFRITQEYIVNRAKALNIQNFPPFCNQYTNNANVRNVDAIQRAQDDLDKLQYTFDTAGVEDKVALQAILDQKKTMFDLEMKKAIEYEKKAKALVDYHTKVNSVVQIFLAELEPEVAKLCCRPADLNSFFQNQFSLLRKAILAIGSNVHQPN